MAAILVIAVVGSIIVRTTLYAIVAEAVLWPSYVADLSVVVIGLGAWAALGGTEDRR